MGACQGRRCRTQVACLLTAATGVAVPVATYRAPVRPVPLGVLADWHEPAALAAGWDVWFGIPTQWTPYADIGTDARAWSAATGMSDLPGGASVVVVGAGVTGLSAAWWLARSGVDVVVVDKGIVGWEASGRNGGGASHYQSPLFAEEQRLWPQMDDLLGYPTEYVRERIIIQRDPESARPLPRGRADVQRDGLPRRRPRQPPVPGTRAADRRDVPRRHPPALRRPRQPAADGAGLCVGAAGPRRAGRPALRRDRLRDGGRAGDRRSRRRAARSPATRSSSPPGRRRRRCSPRSGSCCRWRRRARK